MIRLETVLAKLFRGVSYALLINGKWCGLAVEDIWAYIVSKGIEYNRAYDKLTELGVPLKQQRVVRPQSKNIGEIFVVARVKKPFGYRAIIKDNVDFQKWQGF